MCVCLWEGIHGGEGEKYMCLCAYVGQKMALYTTTGVASVYRMPGLLCGHGDPDCSPHDWVVSTDSWAISPVPTDFFCGVIGSKRNKRKPLELKQESMELEKSSLSQQWAVHQYSPLV